MHLLHLIHMGRGVSPSMGPVIDCAYVPGGVLITFADKHTYLFDPHWLQQHREQHATLIHNEDERFSEHEMFRRWD
jgi:hypothetical protein